MATNMEVVALDITRAWSAEAQRTPLEVEVLEGTVHLTVEGDAIDHVLGSGEVYRGPPGRRIAAMGLSPSRIRVSPAAPPFARLAIRDGRRLARNFLGGTLIVAVWLSLWTWVAVGVVTPLSTIPTAPSTTVLANGA